MLRKRLKICAFGAGNRHKNRGHFRSKLLFVGASKNYDFWSVDSSMRYLSKVLGITN